MRALCGNVRGPMAAGQYIHTFQSLARMADRLYRSRRNTPTASSSSCACSMRNTVPFGISMPSKDLSEEVPAFLSRRRRLRRFVRRMETPGETSGETSGDGSRQHIFSFVISMFHHNRGHIFSNKFHCAYPLSTYFSLFNFTHHPQRLEWKRCPRVR